MATTTSAVRYTTCSGCGRDVRVNVDTGRVVVYVESNGKRGAGHVAKHEQVTYGMTDLYLFLWDCPVCEYADSVEIHEEGS